MDEELKKKLRMICDALWALPDWHDDDINEMVDYQEREVDGALEYIEQAFKDAGYHTATVQKVIQSTAPRMTGKEWFDAFEMFLLRYMPLEDYDADGTVHTPYYALDNIVEAAKKASGIE